MKFTLEIELGNDAMRKQEDICFALDNLQNGLANYNDEDVFPTGSHAIRDVNGNTVGKWEVREDSPIAINSIELKQPGTFTVYARMDEAEQNATAQDYIFVFESIATGTLMYAVTTTPKTVTGKNKVVQMPGPKIETYPVRRSDGKVVNVTVPGREE